MSGLAVRRRLAAVLAADIAGYSRLMGEDETTTVRDLKAHQAVVLPLVGEFGGRIIDTAGDGILAEFASVVNAMECALEIQRAMAERNRDVPAARRMQFRIGINLGDVIHDDARIYGDSINIAARLEGIAEPGGICISAKVREEIGHRMALGFRDLGPQRLKNIAEPVRAYAVEGGGPQLAKTPAQSGTTIGTGRRSPMPAVRSAPIIGRAAELADVRRALESHRVVTIVGPGGMGKTRLAAAVGRSLQADRQPVGWVELAPVSAPELVPHVIADTLGVRLREGEPPVDAVAEVLRRKRMTVVLDNAEHVIDCVAKVAHSLRAAPGIRLLVTSRAPLKLPEETTVRLDGLAVPEAAVEATEAAAFGAVALFCARAFAASRRFVLTDENVEAVVRICRQLDGMPLAIEFAAARVASLGVTKVAEQLSQRLGALSAGSSVAPQRHQTMRAAFDWSYNLLSPREQALFCRLGVFSGGFGVDGAHALAESMQVDTWAADDLLASLVDKSMVVVDRGDPPRYSLLETARTYALEKLQASGADDDARRCHARFVAASLDSAYDAWFLGSEHEWLPQIKREVDNISAALTWALGPRGDGGLAMQLAGTLLPVFLGGRERRIEARAYVDAALAFIDASTPPRTAARLWVAKGMLGRLIDRAASQGSFERAMALYRQAGDERGLAHALLEFARTLGGCGEVARAEQAVDEAEALLRSVRAPMLVGLVSMKRGFLKIMSGQPHEAVVAFKRSTEQLEAAKATTRALQAMSDVADAMWACEQLEDAESGFREVIRRRRETDDSQVLAAPLLNLAGVLIERGKLDEAGKIAREALPTSDQRWTAFGPLALRLALLERYTSAARLYGCTLASYAAAKHRIEPNEARLCSKLEQILREKLKPDELQRLIGEGEKMTEDAACGLAVEV